MYTYVGLVSASHRCPSFPQYEDEGIPCIFDCKFSPDGFMCAAADSSGYLTLFGFGSSHLYEQVVT